MRPYWLLMLKTLTDFCNSLQIIDFGLSRQFTNHLLTLSGLVQTRWYRAPEVILNWEHYTEAGKPYISFTVSYRFFFWLISHTSLEFKASQKSICTLCLRAVVLSLISMIDLLICLRLFSLFIILWFDISLLVVYCTVFVCIFSKAN